MFRFLILLLPLLLLGGSTAEAQRRLRYDDWQLVFSDDFDTYRDVPDMVARSPWQFAPDEAPTLVGNRYEDEFYAPAAVRLQGGYAYLTARPLPEPRAFRYEIAGRDTVKELHFESGWLSLRPDFATNPALGDTVRWEGNRGFQYGLFEIRCRFGGGAGTWPAFWLFNGPSEIDVFEGSGSSAFGNNVHFTPDDPTRASQKEYHLPPWKDLSADFHVFAVAWTPAEVTFYLDGRRLRTVPASELPTFPAPATVIVNQAVLSYADLSTWPRDAQGPYSSLAIDYIKVYKQRSRLPAGFTK